MNIYLDQALSPDKKSFTLSCDLTVNKLELDEIIEELRKVSTQMICDGDRSRLFDF